MAFAVVQGSTRKVRLNVKNGYGYFLIKFTNPFNLDEVYGIFLNIGSTLKPIIEIVDSGGYGVPNPLDGEVNLNIIGNWHADIYAQSSSTNLNINNADSYLGNVVVYVQGDSSCVVPLRNTPVIKSCQDVKNCIGISEDEGDQALFLNQQGDFIAVSGSSGTTKTIVIDDRVPELYEVTHGLVTRDLIIMLRDVEEPYETYYITPTLPDLNTAVFNLAAYGFEEGKILKVIFK